MCTLRKRDSIMYTFIALLTRLQAFVGQRSQDAGVAQQLMASAEARAGLNPRQAQELRGAAYAFLSVVR
jgi:regulator of sirC expression with transglutaminase-like and TPR domain